MRLSKRLLMVGLVAGVCAGSVQAGTIRYRADLVVSKGFVGIPIGQTGAMFVEHADDLPDQNDSGQVGWYGYDDGPVKMLWTFGGANAVQIDTGFIAVGNQILSNVKDFYSIAPGVAYPDTILKGNFAGQTYWGSNSMTLKDTTGTALSSDALHLPVFADYDVQPPYGALSFVGTMAWLGYDVTGIAPISGAEAAARFIAGSPASLIQAIDTPATPFDIAFDYSFDAAAVGGGATLQVLLDGVLLDTINALIADVFQAATVSVTAPALGGATAIDLEFLFNGPTGSTMLLDNVVVDGSDLLNGDFQTHTLAAWDVSGPGSVGVHVATGTVIPVPAAVWLALPLFAGLGAIRLARRRR